MAVEPQADRPHAAPVGLQKQRRTKHPKAHVWPNDFTNFDEAHAAIAAWVIDYNHHRPHDSLGRDTVPAEARHAALDQHNPAA